MHASVDASCWELSVGFRPGDRVVLRTAHSHNARQTANVRSAEFGSPRRPPVGQRDLSSASAWTAAEDDAAEVLRQDDTASSAEEQLCLPSGFPRVMSLPRVKWYAHRLSVQYLNREFAAGEACAVPDQAGWYELGTRTQDTLTWPRVGVRWCDAGKRHSMRVDGDRRPPSHVAAISGSTGTCCLNGVTSCIVVALSFPRRDTD